MVEQERATAIALFDDLSATPAKHFRLYFFGAVFVCIEHATDCAESLDAAIERFPFLLGYYNELAERLAGLPTHEAFERWCRGIETWEERAPCHLPLRALRTALQLDLAATMCLVTVGLVEEDARFGSLFDALQGTSNQRRPTVSFLRQCWRQYLSHENFSLLLRRGRRFGFLHVLNSEVPYQDLALHILPPVWEALRGDEFGGPVKWALYHEPEALLSLRDLILPQETRTTLEALPGLIESGEARVIVVRGPLHNGRRTALGAVARATGRGLLEVSSVEKVDDDRWRQAATLGLLRHALPVAGFDLTPGETLPLPDDWPSGVPLGIVLGRHGGLSGRLASELVTVMLDLPDLASRTAHWQRSLTAGAPGQILEISSRFRIAAGYIHRAARLAKVRALLADHREVTHADVLSATRTLNHQALDGLARRVPAHGDWSQLCASKRTYQELRHLESRCQHRERLPAILRSSPGPPSYGVCALFSGPSGTGKTLAAGLLAASLEKDIYRLDLSAVVNKYIGETEKNLNRALEHAEELDVILLLDEGDALLGRRTDVHSANDRYANLETNFLLQRLESFQGILIVTTNARSRIDSAFERRMDVIVEFSFPTAEERWHLWRAHLPPSGRCDEQILAEIASRCELSGGQIRNAVLHASLLALDNGGMVTTANVEAAVRREYLKQGAACPLRHSSLSV
jgi:ATPase family associated with various cellular activities (AAA)